MLEDYDILGVHHAWVEPAVWVSRKACCYYETRGDHLTMSEETEQKYHLPELISPAELPEKALIFLYAAAHVAEEVLLEEESGLLTPTHAHQILRRIAHDIKHELKDFPTHREGTAELCKYCVADFNNCHLPPMECIANYSKCVHTCTQ